MSLYDSGPKTSFRRGDTMATYRSLLPTAGPLLLTVALGECRAKPAGGARRANTRGASLRADRPRRCTTRRRLQIPVVLLALWGVTTSCEGPTEPVPPSERLRITPDSVELRMGDTVWLAAALVDARGNPASGAIGWTRSNNYVAEVAPQAADARIFAMGPGSAWVHAKSGDFVDSAYVTVKADSVRITKLYAGISTCALTPEGSAYCWGNQLRPRDPGGGTSTGPMFAPAKLPGGGRFSTLAVGHQFACGIASDGFTYCWGVNGATLGGGADGPSVSTVPRRVSGDYNFVTLSAGGFVTCGITGSGEAYCWGNDLYGQLGRGENLERCNGEACGRSPEPVRTAVRFKQIAVGGLHVCGLAGSGETYCWGINSDSQLGVDTGAEVCTDFLATYKCSRLPVRVQGAPAFADIAVGSNHTCAVTAEGSLYCWGNGEAGQLGTGDAHSSSEPIFVAGAPTFVSVTAGNSTTCGITAVGSVFCWGDNSYGQSGADTGERCIVHRALIPCVSKPQQMPDQIVFRQVESGTFHTCGLSAEKRAFCWGKNQDGELGIGDASIRAAGAPLPVFNSIRH